MNIVENRHKRFTELFFGSSQMDIPVVQHGIMPCCFTNIPQYDTTGIVSIRKLSSGIHHQRAFNL